MSKVDFITFCHAPHLERLHAPGVLDEMVQSHRYPFDNIHIIHQRCGVMPYRTIDDVDRPVHIHSSEDYPDILSAFNIKESEIADDLTHGPNAPHYWKWHVINHLIGLVVTRAEYVVFSDCDCLMVRNEPATWILEGIDYLEANRRALVVSPSDGAGERDTQNMSQQLFLCEVARFRGLNFDLPWNGKFDAPGGPMQEYYFMLEGRIGRIMTTYRYHRHVLSEKHRYWHFNPWAPASWLAWKKDR